MKSSKTVYKQINKNKLKVAEINVKMYIFFEIVKETEKNIDKYEYKKKIVP